MAKRKPGQIPGLEDEYTGEVGYEKAVHKTHFGTPGVQLKKSNFNSGYNWVYTGVGRWKLVKLHPDRSEAESVKDAPKGGGTHEFQSE